MLLLSLGHSKTDNQTQQSNSADSEAAEPNQKQIMPNMHVAFELCNLGNLGYYVMTLCGLRKSPNIVRVMELKKRQRIRILAWLDETRNTY